MRFHQFLSMVDQYDILINIMCVLVKSSCSMMIMSQFYFNSYFSKKTCLFNLKR